MWKAEYIRKINKSSLIITPEKECGTERESIEMFRYNHIPYFLKMEEHRKDVYLQFCYDITSRRSLEQLLEYKSLDYGLLLMILNSFDQACIQTEDFMMTENDILLEPEFIFTDHNLEQMFYCYLPGNQEDICLQFKRFMEYLLQYLDHKDEQAVQLAYGVYQRVVEERTALHNVLKDKEQIKSLYQSTVSDQMSVRKDPYQNTVAERIKAGQENERQSLVNYELENRKQSFIQIPDSQRLKNEKQASDSGSLPKTLVHDTDQVSKIQQKETLRKQAAEKLKKMLRKKIYTDRARYTEEDTVFEADEEEPVLSNPTVCLMSETDGIQNQFVYQGADRSRDFQCMQGKLLLGSDKEESDIYIPIPMISRVHARIEIDARGTFLEDMNSTNGTHVNGELLQYRERRILQKGDMISFAGECYSFH